MCVSNGGVWLLAEIWPEARILIISNNNDYYLTINE